MAFAYPLEGGWAEILPGQDVVIGEVASSYATVESWSPQMRASRGIKPIVEGSVPAGKTATDWALVDVDGAPHRVPVLADTPLEALIASKVAAINAKLDAILTGGYTVAVGAMAGKLLQTRGIEDRTNWLVSQASYSAAVAAGQGATIGAKFRTADNVTFLVSYQEGLDILLAMASWGAAAMDRSWVLKDAVRAVQDAAALDAIDIEVGWPETPA